MQYGAIWVNGAGSQILHISNEPQKTHQPCRGLTGSSGISDCYGIMNQWWLVDSSLRWIPSRSFLRPSTVVFYSGEGAIHSSIKSGYLTTGSVQNIFKAYSRTGLGLWPDMAVYIIGDDHLAAKGSASMTVMLGYKFR